MSNVISALGLVKDGEKSVLLNLSNAREVNYETLEEMTEAQKQGVIICPDYPLDEGNMIPASAISYGNGTVADALDEENFNLIKIDSADIINSERCVRIGKVVYISGVVTFGSAQTGSPITAAKIPSEYAPSYNVPIYMCDDINDKVGNGQIFASGGEYMIQLYRPSSDRSTSVSKVKFFSVYVQT